MPMQEGTNLPWSVQKNEEVPVWNKQLPTGVSRKAPGAVPIYTGQAGAYGGNIEYYDPGTGKVFTEHGFIKDNQLANLSPDQRAALAAKAGSSPTGMLSTSDFSQAMLSGYGMPNPNYEAEAAARKAAAGYPGYENHPAYRAPTAALSDRTAQMRYQQALRNGKTLQDPRMLQYIQQRGLTPPSPATYQRPTSQGPIQYPTDPRTNPGYVPPAMTSAGGLQQANTDPLQQMLRTLFAGSGTSATSAGGLQGLPGMAAGNAWGGGQAQGYNLLSLLLQGLMQRGGLPS